MKKYDMHVYQCDFYYHHVKKLLFILYWDIFIYGDGDGVILHEVVDKAVGMQRRFFFDQVFEEFGALPALLYTLTDVDYYSYLYINIIIIIIFLSIIIIHYFSLLFLMQNNAVFQG